MHILVSDLAIRPLSCGILNQPNKQWGRARIDSFQMEIFNHMRRTKVKSRHLLWIKHATFEKRLIERQAIVSVRSWSRPQAFHSVTL